MISIIKKSELMNMTKEELIEVTKDHAIEIHMYNKKWSALCVNDFCGFDDSYHFLLSKTGIKLPLQEIDYIIII